MNSQQPTRVNEITATLRDQILRGQYRPGERLPSERDLANRFDVNRGAIREVLKKLEQLGITSIHPGGARIVPIEQASLDILGPLVDLQVPANTQLICHAIEVLGALISMSARTAVEEADDEQILAMQNIVSQMIENQSTLNDNHENWKALGTLFAVVNNNLVLRLILNGLKTNFLDRVERPTSTNKFFDTEQAKAVFTRIEKSLNTRDAKAVATAIGDHFAMIITTINEDTEVRSLSNEQSS